MSRSPRGINRRQFLELAAVGAMGLDGVLTAGKTFAVPPSTGRPLLRIEMDTERALVPVLSWDTEDGKGGTRFRIKVAPDAELLWGIHPAADRLTMTLAVQGSGMGRMEGVEMLFPFDPGVTPTTVLPSEWAEDGSLRLPAVINAPDFGQMLLADPAHPGLKARLEGVRPHGRPGRQAVDLVVELPALRSGETYTLKLTPVYLPPPEGLVDKSLWQFARRGGSTRFNQVNNGGTRRIP